MIELSESAYDVNSLCQASRRFHALFPSCLYNLNVRLGKISALVWAAKNIHTTTARLSLQAGARITAVKDGLRPITWAAREGHPEIV